MNLILVICFYSWKLNTHEKSRLNGILLLVIWYKFWFDKIKSELLVAIQQCMVLPRVHLKRISNAHNKEYTAGYLNLWARSFSIADYVTNQWLWRMIIICLFAQQPHNVALYSLYWLLFSHTQCGQQWGETHKIRWQMHPYWAGVSYIIWLYKSHQLHIVSSFSTHFHEFRIMAFSIL